MNYDCPFDCSAFRRYHDDLPYPEVTVGKPNLHYARLISGAYAGEGSETTAIAQYMSHRYFTASYPDVFEAYKYIAFVEVIHQNLLGNLILKLGVHPLLFSYETNQFWRGSFPDYQYSIKQIFESDLQGERDAIEHYTRLIHAIDNHDIRSLFKRIIIDEQRHIEIITSLYSRI